MSDSRGLEAATLAAALRALTVLEARGIRAALVGAAALAVHGYARATDDLDFGVAAPSLDTLRALVPELRTALAAEVTLVEPDATDPLGGVITIRRTDIRDVQIVNFVNPLGVGDNPGRHAVDRAMPIELAGQRVLVVTLADVVAMKLFAGGLKSSADVVELLAANPDADLTQLGASCASAGVGREWSALLPEIEARRSR